MSIHIIVFSGNIPNIFFFTKVIVAVLFQLTFVSDEALPPKLSYNSLPHCSCKTGTTDYHSLLQVISILKKLRAKNLCLKYGCLCFLD
jgi:hypothetical protein